MEAGLKVQWGLLQTGASPGATTAARVCVGVAQGFIIPAIHTILSQVPVPFVSCASSMPGEDNS